MTGVQPWALPIWRCSERLPAGAGRANEGGRRGARRAWIVPGDSRDVGATRRLMESLMLAGVEVHVADRDFAADGRRWPAGR